MKIKISILIFMLILVSGIVLAAHDYISNVYIPRARGEERITGFDPRISTYRLNAVVYLKPVAPQYGGTGYGRGGFFQRFPTGVARISSSRHQYYPRGHIELSANNLEETYKSNSLYQGWLFDEESGYSLNLGVFDTIGISGFGVLLYSINHYFDAYDYVIVTKEPLFDDDPSPGEIVLIGEIKKPSYYEPGFSYTKRAYGYREGLSSG